MQDKFVNITLQELADGKYNHLYQLQKLQQCSACYIVELRKEVYSIYTYNDNGDMLPLLACLNKDTRYYLPYQQKSHKNDPIYYFRVYGSYGQGVQELSNMIRLVNATCNIYAGTTGCILALTKH